LIVNEVKIAAWAENVAEQNIDIPFYSAVKTQPVTVVLNVGFNEHQG